MFKRYRTSRFSRASYSTISLRVRRNLTLRMYQFYFAYATERVSRMTVIFTCPG